VTPPASFSTDLAQTALDSNLFLRFELTLATPFLPFSAWMAEYGRGRRATACNGLTRTHFVQHQRQIAHIWE